MDTSRSAGSYALGHKNELPTTFSLASTLALGFSMTNSWLGYSATFITPLLMGGSPAVFFGLLVASVACFFITSGLAELASAYPSSGGQYHFAYMVAAPDYSALVAFVLGWLSVVAWCLTSASTAIVCAQMIGGLVSLHHPGFTMTAWQTWLVYCLILAVTTMIVCFGHRVIPKGEVFFFYCSLSGLLASFVTVLVTQKNKQPATSVFTDFKNHSGWGDGAAFLIAASNSMYAYLAIDGCTHIAEELPQPSRRVPQAMAMTFLIGLLTVFPWTTAFLFCLTNVEDVTNSPIPIFTVYLQATNSLGAATALTAWILFIYCGALVSCLVTTGRLTFAFARDGGLPWSKWFAKVHPQQQVPVNATAGCCVFMILYGLIYIGSTTAFNSFIVMSILSLNVTYAAPQAIVLLRGRGRALGPRPVDLGRVFGPFCNAFSTIWVLFVTVVFCLPTTLPTTGASMNYVCVVVIGVVGIITVAWFGGKRSSFIGPLQILRVEGVDDGQAVPPAGSMTILHKG